jgi:probable HAF family extracellular repeat protein
MEPKRSFVTAIAVVAVLMIPVRLVQAQHKDHEPPKYYVFNLGDPGGGNVAVAASINNIGWIAGDAYQAGNTTEHAELWLGTTFDLGTLGGPNSAVAWPNKNNRGELAGIAETADVNPLGEAWSCAQANFPTITNHVCLGFVWEDGVMSPLPPLPGGVDSYAAGINNHGQVAGWAENGVHDPTCNNAPPVSQFLQFEAVVWGPELGQLTQLSPLSPDPDSAATAINDRGQVVGISGLCANAVGGTSAQHAVLWEPDGKPINLGNFDGGVAWNTPTAINNRGQVVGFGNQARTQGGAFNPVAFFWDKEHGIRSIAPIGDDTNSWAWGINNHGVVVGQSFGGADDPFGRAFVYEHGSITDLNALIQSNFSLHLELANDINDEGEIVGFARDTNTDATVAFLAVPAYGPDSQARAARPADSSLPNMVVPESPCPQPGTFGRFGLEGTGRR